MDIYNFFCCCLCLYSVVDFLQHFEINVELKGVMQDASVMHIRSNVHQKSRMLHCGAVSGNQYIGLSIH